MDGLNENELEFFFDSTCPWTWLSSRWLVEVADARHLTVYWRTFSLTLLNESDEQRERHKVRNDFGTRVMRVIEALRDGGRNDDIGRLYTELGTRIFTQDAKRTQETLVDAARAAGVDDCLDPGDDPRWDAAITSSLDEALSLAGQGIGSPVIAVGTPKLGIFGPIVSPAPTGQEALKLWDAVVTLACQANFFELKRGRMTGPQLKPAP